jgi:hypothetical protein
MLRKLEVDEKGGWDLVKGKSGRVWLPPALNLYRRYRTFTSGIYPMDGDFETQLLLLLAGFPIHDAF